MGCRSKLGAVMLALAGLGIFLLCAWFLLASYTAPLWFLFSKNAQNLSEGDVVGILFLSIISAAFGVSGLLLAIGGMIDLRKLNAKSSVSGSPQFK